MMPRPLALWLTLFPCGGILSAVLWRAEIEQHGWAGLQWLRWFHWAVPVGLAAFIVSALAVIHASRSELRRIQRVGVALVLLAFAAAGHVFTQFALFATHSRAPMIPGSGPSPAVFLGLWLGLALMPASLAALLALLRLFPGWGRVVVANVLWVLAVPAACWAASGISEVEAIKRGTPIPLLYLALALLFMPARTNRAEALSARAS
ncbi:Hypothetical protein A7982_11267 [Minicystis rosea]|nr:Hypothetical protein A7982_11267 [Minicystis rosea]